MTYLLLKGLTLTATFTEAMMMYVEGLLLLCTTKRKKNYASIFCCIEIFIRDKMAPKMALIQIFYAIFHFISLLLFFLLRLSGKVMMEEFTFHLFLISKEIDEMTGHQVMISRYYLVRVDEIIRKTPNIVNN